VGNAVKTFNKLGLLYCNDTSGWTLEEIIGQHLNALIDSAKMKLGYWRNQIEISLTSLGNQALYKAPYEGRSVIGDLYTQVAHNTHTVTYPAKLAPLKPLLEKTFFSTGGKPVTGFDILNSLNLLNKQAGGAYSSPAHVPSWHLSDLFPQSQRDTVYGIVDKFAHAGLIDTNYEDEIKVSGFGQFALNQQSGQAD
jgi:hypothetical protein